MSTAYDRPRLVADIGGTYARFALAGTDRQPYMEKVLVCADYPDIVAAIQAYLNNIQDQRPTEAVLAVALPITGDQVKMTNHVWSFSIEATRRALALERLILLNDFTALAFAVPHLRVDEVYKIGGGVAADHTTIGLIGPGTGLGVSGLIWSGKHWIPLHSEGGHVTFSPIDEWESEIVHIVRKHFNLNHVSAERLISGPGLERIYQALEIMEGHKPEFLEAMTITAQGLAENNFICTQALKFFCAALGTMAGNLALTLGAHGGIYIGGGIVLHLKNFLERSSFREHFEAKGRFTSYLTAIPTQVIIAPNPAIRGAAAFDIF